MTTTNSEVKIRRHYAVVARLLQVKDGFNPRFDYGDIESLKKSIKVHGVLTPLRVRRFNQGYQIVDGHRRHQAIMELPDGPNREVPIILENQNLSDVQALLHMFESNTGKPFLPLEEAAAYEKMRNAGMSVKTICGHVGRSELHVYDTMRLIDSSQEVKDALAAKLITKTDAMNIAKSDKETQPGEVEKTITVRNLKKVKPATQSRKLSDLMAEMAVELFPTTGKQTEADQTFWFDSDLELLPPARKLCGESPMTEEFWMGAYLMWKHLASK